MPFPSFDQNDEILLPFLQASESDEESSLEALLQMVQPLLHSTLRRKALFIGSSVDLEADLMAATMLHILEQLRRCKRSYMGHDSAGVIRHFPALCRTIAQTTINEYLRLKYPRRTSLQNQLLYVIREAKDGNKQPLFALWHDVEERICGFRSWEGRKFIPTSLHHLLETNPQLAMQQGMPTGYTKQRSLSHVLNSMLHWLGGPAVFDTVVEATGCWCGIEEHSEVSLFQPSEEGFAAFDPVAPALSPEQRLLLKEQLRQLWHGITKLSPKHCAALLLNLRDASGRGVLFFFPALGIATFSQIAATMDMDLQQFEALCPRLPLDDSEIGKLYGGGVSSVSVWRSRARTRLLKNIEEDTP
ncbi:hypothetical protein IAD21_00185 [Abditibacteriota bacterium]|nr:hypothetical protein IAD21_00185 [Abditibacteriota bacterium]